MAPTSDVHSDDLIVAVATAPGQAGIGVIRLSGVGAKACAEALCAKTLQPRQAIYTDVVADGELVDQGLVLFFPGPHSFTGEDVVEFQLHGSPVVLQQCLAACTRAGARLARAGEFTERAFLNDKIDLVQAEAIADLISSASVQAARAAKRSLQGVFSEQINLLSRELIRLRLLVEATIDFPEEDQDFLADYDVSGKLQALGNQLQELLLASQRGRTLQAGCTVALLGPPNAGKSSLLNALAEEEAAIVTDVPGTTRDLLKVDLVIEGLPVRLVDTAGLHATQDKVELMGIARAREQVATADVIIVVLDIQETAVANALHEVLAVADLDVEDGRLLVVLNKNDLLASAADIHPRTRILSTVTGFGLDGLKQDIKQQVGLGTLEPGFTARQRHIDALGVCQEFIVAAGNSLATGGNTELIAEDLRAAHDALGQIVGAVTADDLLGKIFSEFCIGK